MSSVELFFVRLHEVLQFVAVSIGFSRREFLLGAARCWRSLFRGGRL